MARTLTLSHPDITKNPKTFVSTDYASGTTLVVKDTFGFSANDFIILGQIASEQCEIVQISSVTNSTTIVLVAGGKFPHAADATVSQVNYNIFRVYRSATGIGGSYTLLFAGGLQVDQSQNEFYDATAAVPMSYKFAYFNATSTVESTQSSELSIAGYADHTLKSMQDAVLDLFGDPDEKMITRNMVTRWLNECYRRLQVMITGGMSPYFVTNTLIASTGLDTYDISAFDMLNIVLIEISRDNGVSFGETMSPADFRYQTLPGATNTFDYRLVGTTLSITPKFNLGFSMRIWYFTNPISLVNETDALIDPFQPILDLFIDWALMRAHEKDRKMTELAAYYRNKVDRALADPNSVVARLKTRLKGGNMTVATTWADAFMNSGM